MSNTDYPCDGHECYDRGNYHVSCPSCPLHHSMSVIKEAERLGVKPKGLQDYLNDDPSLTEKKTYEEMKKGLFCETD